MTLHLSIVADVFPHEAQAKHALEALRLAGFHHDQIGIAMQGHEGIDLLSDLQNLGVSYEHASYYAQEVKAGHTVVSVRPDGREQEAHEIMRRSGALPDADTTASQTSNIDKQRAAWEQSAASHQAYLAEQRASNTHEDFHRPRSLKPRAAGQPVTTPSAQTNEGGLHSDVTIQPNARSASVVQNEVVTGQKPSIAPVVKNVEKVIEQKVSDAPVAQQQMVPEHLLPVEEEHHDMVATDDEITLRRLKNQGQMSEDTISPQNETVATDDEITLRRLKNQGQMSEDTISPQKSLKKSVNRNMVKPSVLAGGLSLAVGTSVLLAFLQRAQIRQFLLSIMRTVNKQRMTVTRRNRNDQ